MAATGGGGADRDRTGEWDILKESMGCQQAQSMEQVMWRHQAKAGRGGNRTYKQNRKGEG